MRFLLPSSVNRHPSAALSAAFPRHRLMLWVPALLMTGITAYFLLPREPSPYVGITLVTGLLSITVALYRRGLQGWFMTALGLLIAAVGFTAADMRTAGVAAPVLENPINFVNVTGELRGITVMEKGVRLLLSSPTIEDVAPENTPLQVRVTSRKWEDQAKIGDRVALKASLAPPPGPIMPGGYDFARHFYFAQIGGLGYAVGPVTLSEVTNDSAFSNALKRYRHALGEELRAAIPGPAGAVATALAVGEQGAIPSSTQEDMRASGLSHILSISGLHLALAAGIMFFGVRTLLTLIPSVALKWPTKKIAACAALLSSFGYLLLAGSPVPAQRSFIMVAFALVAVLIDRRGVSLYSLMWAAVALLLLFPESVFNVSFQMSFAATLAIVALYERHRGFVHRMSKSMPRRALRYLAGILLTSLAASLATTPFVMYHFNRFTLMGIIANMAVMPLSSFIIMPGVVLTLLGFGFIGVPMLHYGIEAMLWIARVIAALPYAYIPVYAPSDAGLALTAAGLLILTLLRTRLALIGIPLWAAGIATSFVYQPPDVLIGDTGRQVVVRLEDGRYASLKGNGRSFAARGWLTAAAQEQSDYVKPKEARSLGVRCDKTMCRYAGIIAVRKFEAIPAACAQKPDVLTAWRYMDKTPCTAQLIIARKELEEGGAHALYRTHDGWRIETAYRSGHRRPWSPQRHNDDADDATDEESEN